MRLCGNGSERACLFPEVFCALHLRFEEMIVSFLQHKMQPTSAVCFKSLHGCAYLSIVHVCVCVSIYGDIHTLPICREDLC